MLHLYFEAQLEVVCVVGDAFVVERRQAAARGRAGSLLVITQLSFPSMLLCLLQTVYKSRSPSTSAVRKCWLRPRSSLNNPTGKINMGCMLNKDAGGHLEYQLGLFTRQDGLLHIP